MKYFAAALPLAASMVAAQSMQVMSLASAVPAGAATHTIVVGGNKPVATGMAPALLYTPEAITAAVGDMVMFIFMQKNHTATQSTFADPCKKMDGGMDSGFMVNPDGKAGVTWNMTVQTVDPLWFYCKQQNGIHCGKGMTFSVNAATTGDKTMADFKGLAVSKNGSSLAIAGLQKLDAQAAAVPTTVTVAAAAAATGGTAASGTAAAVATVIAGAGQDQTGNSCTCSCLCGMNSFPASAAVNSFGGFPGLMM